MFPISEVCLNVEPLSDARTLLADFFSILLGLEDHHPIIFAFFFQQHMDIFLS